MISTWRCINTAASQFLAYLRLQARVIGGNVTNLEIYCENVRYSGRDETWKEGVRAHVVLIGEQDIDLINDGISRAFPKYIAAEVPEQNPVKRAG